MAKRVPAMVVTVETTAAEVAAYLGLRGYPIGKIEIDEEAEDPRDTIKIGDAVTVDLGFGSVSVTKDLGNGEFVLYTEWTDVSLMLPDLDKALGRSDHLLAVGTGRQTFAMCSRKCQKEMVDRNPPGTCKKVAIHRRKGDSICAWCYEEL